ncbi:MAG: prepilin-type N-terminal cleavage/methylation domain-containing protein [Candidatus Taylorbacteria bacterium]|nr:prepilin-type N-terminal cleavage/methylation domain-containing protein [Candidatus Taylorbacteria bacterium]
MKHRISKTKLGANGETENLFALSRNFYSVRSSGFSLVEMIVSIALFSFVMLAVTGVLLSVVDANHKAQGLKTTINNLSLALESLTRNLRTGTAYQATGNSCGSTGSDAISFLSHSGEAITYSLGVSSNGGGAILVSNSSYALAPITAPEINMDRLCFYISGNVVNNGGGYDLLQPKVLVTIGGIVSNRTAPGARIRTTSRLDIQTLVSQRFPDVPQN